KNSTRYNRTRNFGLYGHAESKKTQKFVFRSALRPNQISFSHGQDPLETLRGSLRLAAVCSPRLTMWTERSHHPAQALARMVWPTNAFPSDQIARGIRSLSLRTESNALTIHSQSAPDITSQGKSLIV